MQYVHLGRTGLQVSRLGLGTLAFGWKTSEAENEGYVKTMASHGIKIMKPSAKLAAEFEAIGKQMAVEWAKKAGAEGEAILSAFQTR